MREHGVNWALGLRGLFAAMALAGVGSASGSKLPMVAALLVAGWAVVKPLRFASWALAPATLRFVGLMAVRVVALAVAATVLSLAVNSREAVLNVPGTLLFIAMILVVAVMSARFAWVRASRLAPRAWGSLVDAGGGAREQVAVLLGSIRLG